MSSKITQSALWALLVCLRVCLCVRLYATHWSRIVYQLEQRDVSWAILWVTVTLARRLDSSSKCVKIDLEAESEAAHVCGSTWTQIGSKPPSLVIIITLRWKSKWLTDIWATDIIGNLWIITRLCVCVHVLKGEEQHWVHKLSVKPACHHCWGYN